MKKCLIAVFALAAFAGSSFAADVINLKKDVKFPHKKHVDMLKDCKKCHEAAPGKIKGFGKDWAHKTCKGCHTDMKKGPTACGDCHKK